MKKILIILCTPLFLFCQDTTYTHQLEWNSNFLFESNSLDKSFLITFLYGGYITDNMKTEWINSGSENNIIHAEISNGFSRSYHFKKQSIGFSFADRNILNASFTDDLLRIGFEGNYNYQDEILNFDNTSIRADRFQQYKLRYGTEIKGNKIKCLVRCERYFRHVFCMGCVFFVNNTDIVEFSVRYCRRQLIFQISKIAIASHQKEQHFIFQCKKTIFCRIVVEAK